MNSSVKIPLQIQTKLFRKFMKRFEIGRTSRDLYIKLGMFFFLTFAGKFVYIKE